MILVCQSAWVFLFASAGSYQIFITTLIFKLIFVGKYSEFLFSLKMSKVLFCLKISRTFLLIGSQTKYHL